MLIHSASAISVNTIYLLIIITMGTLIAFQTGTDTFANSVDPDEMAPELSHQGLQSAILFLIFDECLYLQ